MTQVTASVGSATQWASEGPVPAEDWNPVYRALREPPAREGRGRPDEATVDLVLRQLTAPALLVVAVTDAERTRRMRIGLDPVVATLEHSEDDEPSHWSRIDAQEVPTRITAMLEEAGIDLAPARLGVERGSTALRLSAEQGRAAAGALARGLAPEEAFAAVPALDAPLRDALTATGPRLSLALALHDPQHRVTEEPVTWSRLWATGRRGLYRLDQPTSPALSIHPVDGGDVLGTLLPILEQGLRFAAACTPAGGAR